MELIDFGTLADAVSERAPDQPLDRLEAALTLCEEMASGADQFVGRFVAAAREAGCSWTEIGERMGVSKQAARQRFVQRAPTARRRRRGKPAYLRCSFCGKARPPDMRLIGGPGVYICAECVGTCSDILAEERCAP